MTHDLQHNPLPMMTPGIRPGESPPFHKIGEYIFQDLCRDLFDAEPDIATCEVYGKRGQTQDGIDLLAYRKKLDGTEVGQCKCYEKFTPGNIRSASDEFFKYWDTRWSSESVKRFILFVACDLILTQQQDMIREQRRRFAGYGIEYEAWPAPKLRNKLRSQKGIVSTYCKPEAYWVSEICGEVPPVHTESGGSKGHITVIVDTALANKIEQLSTKLSGEIDRQLEQSRIALQEGRKDEAALWVKTVKADGQLWTDLLPQVKAKILVFEAILIIDTAKNIELVKKLADEAQSIDPNVVQHRLRALITYKERGPSEAIKVLDGHEDIDSINLKAAFLLEMGDAEQSLSILSFES